MTSDIINTILQTVQKTIRDYNMLIEGQSVLAAVSGGPDSTALFDILRRLSSIFNIKLAIAHLNHNLRGAESRRDACFAADLAKKFSVPFFCGQADVLSYKEKNKLSLEEAAREMRYTFLNEIAEAKGFDRIAVGHNRDDNAELVLMNIIKGTGYLGLSGIPRARENIIRPMLDIARTEILDYLNAVNLDYIIDFSNYDTHFLRNKIRCNLIPLLEESYNPQIKKNLDNLSRIIKDENSWMEKTAVDCFKDSIINYNNSTAVFSAPKLRSVNICLQRRIIRHGLKKIKGDLKGIGFAHIEAVLNILQTDTGNKLLDLPHNLRIKKIYDKLTICRQGVDSIQDFEYVLYKPGTVFIEEIKANFTLAETNGKALFNIHNSEKNEAFFDAKQLRFPVTIRNFRPGDRFFPLGMKGGQKLKKFFINNKIDRSKRSKIPILLSRGNIAWVIGCRLDDRFKISDLTRGIVKGNLEI